MKLFYWGCPDPVTGGSDRLFVAESGNYPMQVFDGKAELIVEILKEGGQEISFRTAHALGWPV